MKVKVNKTAMTVPEKPRNRRERRNGIYIPRAERKEVAELKKMQDALKNNVNAAERTAASVKKLAEAMRDVKSDVHSIVERIAAEKGISQEEAATYLLNVADHPIEPMSPYIPMGKEDEAYNQPGADPKIYYTCDPEKNINCKKIFCQKQCHQTTHVEFAKQPIKVVKVVIPMSQEEYNDIMGIKE